MPESTLEEQAAMEKVLELALAEMRRNEKLLKDILRQWTPEKRGIWYEVDKVNNAAWQVHQAASTASRLLDLIHPYLVTYDRNPRYIEIGKVFEGLSSWDLYARFGWTH